MQGAELPTREQVVAAARQAGLVLATPSGTVESAAADGPDMGKHFAATLRVWRLQLVHVWHACWKVGGRDSQLRQCAPANLAATSGSSLQSNNFCLPSCKGFLCEKLVLYTPTP